MGLGYRSRLLPQCTDIHLWYQHQILKIIKTSNIRTFLLVLIFSLSGCDNFLDTENLVEKTTANFPATETEANEMLTSIYANLLFADPETSSFFYFAHLASDDCLGGIISGSNNCATIFLMFSFLNIVGGFWG